MGAARRRPIQSRSPIPVSSGARNASSMSAAFLLELHKRPRTVRGRLHPASCWLTRARMTIRVRRVEATARRVPDMRPSAHAAHIVLQIQGPAFDRPVHADGIAHDPAADVLYFQVPRARSLYRQPWAALRDGGLSDAALAEQVEKVADSGASGRAAVPRGRVCVSALEQDAIRPVSPDGCGGDGGPRSAHRLAGYVHRPARPGPARISSTSPPRRSASRRRPRPTASSG